MRKRFHGLKRVKFRASWNKYNLYNLSRLKLPFTQFLTFYQQKWASKSLTRAYHGEYIREKQWERMFDPRLNAVIPMDHRYLAEHDGSELAAGRGSGKDIDLKSGQKPTRADPIPYMSMTYAPMERRLDMAVWRALFASSARQARQFVVHGNVKVNGKKMRYPGYLLNPGDMFQVKVDRVLFATGARKETEQIREGRERRAASAKASKAQGSSKPEKSNKDLDPEVEEKKVKRVGTRADRIEHLDLLRSFAAGCLLDKKNIPSAKMKQAFREIRAQAKLARTKTKGGKVEELDVTIAEITNRLKQLSTKTVPTRKYDTGMPEEKNEDDDEEKKPERELVKKEDDPVYQGKVARALQRMKENPVEAWRPYATPWTPRPYMSAFAFIPRYLEVNHKICSAVYLRHPVARPGMSEVPTPFPMEIQQLAFNWYLRRR